MPEKTRFMCAFDRYCSFVQWDTAEIGFRDVTSDFEKFNGGLLSWLNTVEIRVHWSRLKIVVHFCELEKRSVR